MSESNQTKPKPKRSSPIVLQIGDHVLVKVGPDHMQYKKFCRTVRGSWVGDSWVRGTVFLIPEDGIDSYRIRIAPIAAANSAYPAYPLYLIVEYPKTLDLFNKEIHNYSDVVVIYDVARN